MLKILEGDSWECVVAIFQPIFSFIHCYHLQFHRRFQPFSPSLLCHSYCTVPHHVSRFIYTAASSPVFFSFVSRLSVLFNPFFANPLFRRSSFGSQTVHTRELSSTRNGISVGSPFLSLFSSLFSRPRVVARSTVANCEYAHYRYLQTARTRLLVRAPRLFSFQISTRIDESFDPSFRSRFSLSPLSRLLLPSVVFFAPLPLQRDAQGVFRKGRIEERSLL